MGAQNTITLVHASENDIKLHPLVQLLASLVDAPNVPPWLLHAFIDGCIPPPHLQSTLGPIPKHLQDEYSLDLRHSCMVPITTNGQVIFKFGLSQYTIDLREGFGGGKEARGLLYRILTSRREAFMEGNFDCTSSAVLRISPPIFIINKAWSHAWGSYRDVCLLQFMLIDERCISYDMWNRIWIDKRCLWSRERSGAYFRRRIFTSYGGDFVCDENAQNLIWQASWKSEEGDVRIPFIQMDPLTLTFGFPWRKCDKDSMKTCMSIIQALLHNEPISPCFRLMSPDVRYDDYKILCALWPTFFGEIASLKWSLPLDSLIYQTLWTFRNRWLWDFVRHTRYSELTPLQDWMNASLGHNC